MQTPKKLVIALAVIFLVGATPLAAQIAGTWAGTGTGSCSPYSGTVIYPWQRWGGEIPTTQTVFEGEWKDSLDNRGVFEGEVTWISMTVAIAKGEWYWYDPTGSSSEPVYGGDFEMKFYAYQDECEGIWTTIWPSPSLVGTMRGEKID